MKRLACLIALAAAALGCSPDPIPNTSGKPQITSFTATPAQVHSGAMSTLAWQITGGFTALSIDQGVGDVSTVSSQFVGPVTATTTYTLTATNSAGSSTATATVTVQPGPNTATGFLVTLPSTATTGAGVSVQVKAVDGSNSVVTGFTGTVHLASTDGSATLPADYTFTSGDAGVHSFNVTFNTVGAQTVTASSGSLSKTSATCTVSTSVVIGPATSCAFSNVPANTAAGAVITAHVKLLDANSRVATGYTGTLAYTSTDGAATLPAASAFTSSDAGERDVSITFQTAGHQSVTAKDQNNNSITCTASSTVSSAPALAHLVFSNVPASATGGTAITFTVTAQDSSNATLSGYAGHVTFTSSDSSATLPSAYDFVSGDHGAHQFSATFATSGSQTITVTDSSASISATSSGVTVTVVSGSSLVYTNPAAGGKVRLVKNSASTSTTVVLDLVVNAALTGYSVALNLPVAGSGVQLDASPITKGTALDPGSAPAAIAVALPSSGPLSGVLTSGLSQKAGGTGAVTADASLTSGQILYTLKLDLQSAATTGTVFDGASLGSRFHASLRNKAGSEVAGPNDFAIGKLEVR